MNGEAPKTTGIPWPAVRSDYENNHGLVAEIAARYGVSSGTIYEHARREGWRLRQPACAKRKTKEEEPLQRLKRLARRRIGLLEQSESSASGDDGTDAAIARMAGLLKLIERITTLEQKEKALARAKKPPRIVNDARRLELARRLENLRRQLEAEGDHQASEG